MVKRALLIAFHFPPVRHSSGIQRTLGNAIHLREQGWQPLVLTVNPRAYRETGDDQMGDVPQDVEVVRAFALDTKRHLSIAGRYPGWLAAPDRYATWLPGGLWSGLRMVRRHRPRVIWSTFPVPSAHRLGYWLHRLTGLPWVADFRDSMTEPDYPPNPVERARLARLERATVHACSRAVFTTPSARAMYAARYPELPDDRWALIPNGFDEARFRDAEGLTGGTASAPDGPLRLVHAGSLYPSERDPTAFFEAIRRLKEQGRLDANRARVILRASGHDPIYGPRLAELGIDDVVELAPPLGYRETLAEMLTADGLLLFQAASCNHQIPAKLYEYLRARRPVLALTDAAGDTAATLREAGIDTILPLTDADAIERGLMDFLDAVRSGSAPVADPVTVAHYSRAGGAAQLARIFDEVAPASSGSTPGNGL